MYVDPVLLSVCRLPEQSAKFEAYYATLHTLIVSKNLDGLDLGAEADAVGRASAFADGGEFLSGEGVVAGHEPLVEVHRQLIESNALRG